MIAHLFQKCKHLFYRPSILFIKKKEEFAVIFVISP